MGRKKDREKRRKREENRFSSFQSSSDEDENSEVISEKTIKFQVSLKPHGSKIKKPTNFFQGALAEIVKRESICDKLAVKNVTFLKDDMFLVETTEENAQVVVKLMEAGEFEYASKSIQILSISGGTISQNGDTDAGTATKENDSSFPATSADTNDRIIEGAVGPYPGSRPSSQSTIADDEETDIKLLVSGLPEDFDDEFLTLYFENARNCGTGCVVKSMEHIGQGAVMMAFENPSVIKNIVERKHKFKHSDIVVQVFDERLAKDPKKVMVHGITEKIDEEFLKMYFENPRRGGGVIEDFKKSTSSAVITFAKEEDAQNVLKTKTYNWKEMTLVVEEYKEDPLSFITPVEERNSAILEEKDSLSSDYVVVEQERANAITTKDEEDIRDNPDVEIEDIQEWGRILVASADSAEIDEESLHIFFESEEVGGGGIVSIEHVGYSFKMIFADIEVAERLLAKGEFDVFGHKVSFKQFQCTSDTQIKEEMREEIHGDAERSLEVHGDVKKLDKQFFTMYLQNEKKSGGGKIEKIDFDAKPVIVTFHEVEAARRVLEKGKLTLKSKELTFKPVEKESVRDIKKEAHVAAASSTDMRRVEIHGDIAKIGKDLLVMYLESEKKSGGGKMLCQDLQANPPTVTFIDEKAADRVISKASHTLRKIDFSVKRPTPTKPEIYEEHAAVITNLNPKTSKDSVDMYIERIFGCEADSVEYNYDKTAVMLSLSRKIEWERVHERHSKKSSLDGNELKISRVTECDSVIVSNIAKETTEDGLSLKLSNLVGDENIGNIAYNRKKEFAIIKIGHPQAVKKLKSNDITLDGNKLVIQEHNKCFITDRTWKMLKKEPDEVSVEVDHHIIQFILNNRKKELTDVMKTEVYMKNKTSGDGKTACFACFTPMNNMPEAQNTFREFYHQFKSQTVSIDEDSNFDREIQKEMQKRRLDVAIVKSTPGNRMIIGRVADVQQIILFIDKLAEEAAIVECKVPIDSDKLDVLLTSGYLEELEQEMNVKVTPKKDGINISGPEKRLATVKETVMFRLMSVKERHEKLSRSICAILKQNKGYKSAMELVRKHGLKITFNVDSARNEINFTGLSDKDLRKGIEVFMNNVVDIEIPTRKEDASLVSGQKASKMLRGLRESNGISIDVKGSKILLSGVKEICNRVEREIEDFLQQNAFHKRVIPLTFGKTKAVLTLARDKVEDLKKEFKDYNISLKETEDKCGIEVSGHGGSVENVLREMTQISGDIKSEEKILQRPGVTKIIESTSFKNAKSGLESEKKVVIVNKADDKVCSVVNEEVKQNYVVVPRQSSRLICQFKTNKGHILSVYHGDITKHQADVIVNPANENLLLGGGVAGAIAFAGGSRIQDECNNFVREFGKVEISGAAMTTAGNMNLKGVIHAVGPHWPQNERFMGERELQQNQRECKALLRETMANVLLHAEDAGCAILAVPAISSGIFGFPKDLCAQILTDVTLDQSEDESLSNIREIHFINNDAATVDIFSSYFRKKFGQQAGYQKVNNVDSMSATANSDVKYRRQYERPNPLPRQQQQRQQQRQQHQQQQQQQGRRQEERSHGPVGGAYAIQAEGGITIELVVGDLAKQKVDVIVNSVSTDLNLSRNPCALGLSKAAGPQLQKLCHEWIQTNGNLAQYDFAITKSGKLQCQFVFHAACGDYNGATTEKQLEDLCTNMLQEASKRNAKEIAIPALGTGTLNFPRDKVAQIMISCATEFGKKNGKSTSIKKVCLVAYHLDQLTIDAFETVLSQPASSGAPQKHEKVRRAPSQQPSQSRFALDGGIKLGDVSVEVLKGDITEERTDAVAVFGNTNLNLGGAVGQAICRKEGRQIEEEARSKAPQKAGSTVLLKTRELPSKYIAHIYPQSESYDGLKEATRSMFQKCDKNLLKSVSIPAIGTGVMGKSAKTSAQLILHSFAELSVKGSLKNIKKVRIIIFEGKMVDDFKAELANVLSNPEEFLKNAGGGVVNWIKEKVAYLASFLSSKTSGADSSCMASTIPGDGKEDFEPVTLVLYGFEQKAMRECTRRLVDIVEENINAIKTTREDYKQLTAQQIKQIKSYAMKRDVLFEIDKKSGTVRSIGFAKDAANILSDLNDLIADQLKEKQELEKQQLVAGLVQWKEVQTSSTVINYDPILNCELETLFQEKKSEAEIKMEDDNGESCTFKVDFGQMTCTNLKNKEKREIIRDDMGESKSPLPQEWDKMPTNPSGHEFKVHVVKLQPTSPEFKKIHALYMASAQGQIQQVLEIRRIQNPQLYKSFMAKKESMEKTAGAGSDNEKRLFHGTSASSVDEINESGFNRSFAGVNGTAYGNGVYFARDSSYSAGYARQGTGGRFMYLARVLVGKHTAGQNGMKVPPKGFDTVANDTSQNPGIIVVFYDNQCYPEYLLVFQ